MTEQPKLLLVALEDQVVSLVTSRKLEEIGIKGASIFVWEYYDDRCHGVKFFPYALVNSFAGNVKIFAAYTAAEILSMLPNFICIEENEPFNCFRLHITGANIVKDIGDELPIDLDDISEHLKLHHIANYHCDTYSVGDFLPRMLLRNTHHENLAECLAQLLITLHEKGFVK